MRPQQPVEVHIAAAEAGREGDRDGEGDSEGSGGEERECYVDGEWCVCWVYAGLVTATECVLVIVPHYRQFVVFVVVSEGEVHLCDVPL